MRLYIYLQKTIHFLLGSTPTFSKNTRLSEKTPPTHANPLLFSCFTYKDPNIKSIILEIKNHRNKEALSLVTPFLRKIIQNYQKEHFTTEITLIPVPISKKRFHTRGYNQSEFIAQGIRELDKDIFCIESHLLTKIKETPHQARLSRKERVRNLNDCFEITKEPFPKNTLFVLVDDVITTGTTMERLITLLKESGAEHVIGVSIGG
jgi:ComF family protein